MLSTLQRINAFVQRRPAIILAAKLAPETKQPCLPTDWSLLLPKHYSSAPPKQSPRRWTSAETQKLAEILETRTPWDSHGPDWKALSNHLGRTIPSCMKKYYQLRKDRNREQQAIRNDFKVLSMMASDTARIAQASIPRWSDDEVSRLRKAVRETVTKNADWASIAKYVGNGRTTSQCLRKWNKLRVKDELKDFARETRSDLGTDQINKSTAASLAGDWTAEEMAMLQRFIDTHKGSNRSTRMKAAYAMFPHKPQTLVKHMIWSALKRITRKKEVDRRKNARQHIWQMVSDYGGAEKADWAEIGKAVGLTVYRCQNIYNEMLGQKYRIMHWTPDETNRLVAALRSQRSKGCTFYDWIAAALAVKTRTPIQCYAKLSISKKVKQAIEESSSSRVSSLSKK